MEQDYSQMTEDQRIYGGELSKQFLTSSTETDEHRRERMEKSLNAYLNLKLGEEDE